MGPYVCFIPFFRPGSGMGQVQGVHIAIAVVVVDGPVKSGCFQRVHHIPDQALDPLVTIIVAIVIMVVFCDEPVTDIHAGDELAVGYFLIEITEAACTAVVQMSVSFVVHQAVKIAGFIGGTVIRKFDQYHGNPECIIPGAV